MPFVNQKFDQPILDYKNHKIFLNEIGENVFEFKSEEVISKLLFKLTTGKDFVFKKEDPQLFKPQQTKRQFSGGKTAFIVPFFSFYKNDVTIENYNIFKSQIPEKDLFVIELSFFDLPFFIKEAKIRLKAGFEGLLWQKERLMNIILSHIPREYANIAWVDADILFRNKNFIKDIDLKLNDHSVIQLFKKANWLEADNRITQEWQTIIFNNDTRTHHPGFGWAARREEIEKIKFFDYHITGNGDVFIYSLLSGTRSSWSNSFLKLPGVNYYAEKYIEKARKYLKSDVSYLDDEIDHLYHGDYSNRLYHERHMILEKGNFDPVEHLRINDNGLFEWNFQSEEAKKISQDINNYLKLRKEYD